MARLSQLIQGGLPKAFMNQAYMQWAKQDFVNNMNELNYDDGFFDIFRDLSKIASQSNVTVSTLDGGDADGKVELTSELTGNTNSRASDSNSESATAKRGLEINPNVDLDGIQVSLSTNTSGTATVYLHDNTGTILTSTGLSSSSTKLYYSMTSGNTYYITVDNNGSSYTSGFYLNLSSTGNTTSRPDDNSTYDSIQDNGLKVTANSDLAGFRVTISSNMTGPNTLKLMDSGGTLLESKDVSSKSPGDTVDMLYSLNASTDYIITITHDTESGTYDSASYPYTGADFDIVAGIYNESTTISYKAYNIKDITGIERSTIGYPFSGTDLDITAGTDDGGSSSISNAAYNINDLQGVVFQTGNIESVTKDFGSVPSTIILSNEINLNSGTIEYTVSDNDANSITVTQSEIDTEVDLSSFTSSIISIQANLTQQSGGQYPVMFSYAAYFQE